MTGRRFDVDTATRALIVSIADEPWGQTSPSVYETGRLVSFAPRLAGHARRVRFLVDTQFPDRGWSAQNEYGLVPTLSATEALLTTLERFDRGESGTAGDVDRPTLLARSERGLETVREMLTIPAFPDLPAIEIIVPSLVESINERLGARRGGERLTVPRAMDTGVLTRMRSMVRGGDVVPEKLLHALEAAGPAAHGAHGVRVASSGSVGASPAATAAWLGEEEPAIADRTSRLSWEYLKSVVARTGGPVPCGIPITVFERAWVITTLARAGIRPPVPRDMIEGLDRALGVSGTPGGSGLPPDADTTAVTLYALGLSGRCHGLDCLWAYETETHFCTWQGEQGISTSVNAHVLEAFGYYLAQHPEATSRYLAAVDKLSRWLQEHQLPDGSWLDRWHVSAYYATTCVVLALDRFGLDPTSAVRRAVDWVLDTQRPDGSWGTWAGTSEETAYAMQILLCTEPKPLDAARAAARGHAYLLSTLDHVDGPALWIDKDLYHPAAIVRANVLAAIQLAQANPAVGSFATTI